jgi:hypothetical protein
MTPTTPTCKCCGQSLHIERVRIKPEVGCFGQNKHGEHVWGHSFEALGKTFKSLDEAELYIRSQGKEVWHDWR